MNIKRSHQEQLSQASKRIEELESKLKEAQIKGFKDGWESSGEGFNSEYGAKTEEVLQNYIDELNSENK